MDIWHAFSLVVLFLAGLLPLRILARAPERGLSLRLQALDLLVGAGAAAQYLGTALARFLNFLSFHSFSARLEHNLWIARKLDGLIPITHLLDIEDVLPG